MTDRPTYLILVCKGRRCVPILDLDGIVTTEADAVAVLAEVAARLRRLRALGRVVLVEAGSGRQIASLRVRPVARRRG